ncbi:MAG: zinc ribbon domain-containing protein [Verrucomicrobia bacterium]|nr:zinc ribbon domain-containing protein [Verrucomicrobiota bacterium]
MPPEICPNCGAEVPPNAQACPECGSDEQTGWAEAAETGGLDLPDQNFDYNDFVKREFSGKTPVPRGIHWLWWLIALLLVAGFFAGLLL